MSMREAFRRAGVDVPDEPERREEMVTDTSPQNRRCDNCGEMFEARLPHHSLCDDCHSNSRQRSSGGRAGSGQNVPQRSYNYRYLGQFPDSYFDADEQGRDCLLTDFVASSKVQELAKTLGENVRPPLTYGQLRRFFNHCRDIERRLEIEGESWQCVAARFVMLSAHAHSAAASPSKIPLLFRDFIDVNVGKVKSSHNPRAAFLNGFLPHFEALVGFGAAHMKDS